MPGASSGGSLQASQRVTAIDKTFSNRWQISRFSPGKTGACLEDNPLLRADFFWRVFWPEHLPNDNNNNNNDI
jgi:hypothetical protein